MRRVPKKTVLALFVVGAVGYFVYDFFAMPTVRPHTGDGHFENHSWRFPWVSYGIPVPGYTIDFPRFDLSTDFEASYDFQNLPKLKNEVGVYLSISDPQSMWRDDRLRKELNAHVQFDIYDEEGKSVCHVDQPLAKMWWADPEGGIHCYGLHDSDKSLFASRPGARYRLRVRYTADPKLSGFEGFIHIRCGGSI